MQDQHSKESGEYSDDSDESIAARIHSHIVDQEQAEAIDLIDDLEDVDQLVSQGKTLLHWAAEEGCNKVVRALLEAGADQLIASEGDDMLADALPLHYAAYYGQTKCVRELLNALDGQGAVEAMSTKDYAEFTPLQEAIAAFAEYHYYYKPSTKENEQPLQKWLRKKGIQHQGNLQNYLDIIDLFIVSINIEEYAWDITSDTQSESLPYGCNLAHLAARFDMLKLFECLFDNCPAIFYKREKIIKDEGGEEDETLELASTPVGPTAIHTLLCAEYNKYNFCQQLLLKRLDEVDINCVDCANRSVIFYLVMSNNIKMMERVLEKNPNLHRKDVKGLSVYDYAVIFGSVEALSLLLKSTKDKFILNLYSGLGRLLHIAYNCCQRSKNSIKSLRIMRLLINFSSVEINATDRYGRTVFMYATKDRNIAVIKLIQQHTQHKPNILVSGTGDTKQILDLEASGREMLDMREYTGDFELDAENEAVIETVAEFAFDDQREEGIVYSDDEDEGDAPIHQAIKQHIEGKKRLLSTMLEDERVDDRVKNASGTKALKLAKEEDGEAYKLLREAQYEHYKSSSTGSSGSEDVGGQSTYKPFLEQLMQEQEVDDVDEVGICDAEIDRDLELINKEIENGRIPPGKIAERYCVIHYRGINFLRDIFSHDKRRNYGKSHHEHSGVHSKFSHFNADVNLDIAERTPEDEILLNKVDEQCRLLWQKVFLQPRDDLKAWKGYNASGHNKDGFICYAHLAQCRYSNTASVKDPSDPKQQVEIWDEIWGNIGEEIRRSIQEIQGLEELEFTLDLKGSPFVSTGKAPQHAISYAVGKSLADVNRNQRMDSRTDRRGRPKYELIGKVHWFCHSITDYLSANPNDVLLWHKAGALSVGYRLLNETEVAFIGGIAAQHHIDSIPIVQPRFDIDYDPEYHGKLMGLSPEQYRYFSSSYPKAQRPSRHGLDIFEKPYHDRLKAIFDLDPQQFTRYKALIAFVRSYQQGKKKMIDLQELEPYKDLLLKEINIKLADRNKLDTFYGKKGIDKYWHKPKKAVSIARLFAFIKKNLRDRSPYRKLKNEIRSHLINFYAEQIFRKANAEARSNGNIPIYRAPDGKFKRLPKTADLLKKSLVEDAKRDNKDKKRKAEEKGVADTMSKVGFMKRLHQQTYSGAIPLNPRREFQFRINIVLGDGNCAVTSLPVRDRRELCEHLMRAIVDMDNRQMLINELLEALTMGDKFLSPGQTMVWQGFEQAQIDYDLAVQTFAGTLAQYKQILIDQGLIPQDSSDVNAISFIKNNTAFNGLFIEFNNLHQQKKYCKGRIENIDARKRAFLASVEVCKSYIDNQVAKEGQWVGKGCIHLLAKMKGISLCVWTEQKQSAELQYDSTYSVLAHNANSPDAQIHHVVYMQGSNHYNLLQVIRDSYQLEADLGAVLR